VICLGREANYFSLRDWTTQISLIALAFFLSSRKRLGCRRANQQSTVRIRASTRTPNTGQEWRASANCCVAEVFSYPFSDRLGEFHKLIFGAFHWHLAFHNLILPRVEC
jgi:hypothetical protein